MAHFYLMQRFVKVNVYTIYNVETEPFCSDLSYNTKFHIICPIGEKLQDPVTRQIWAELRGGGEESAPDRHLQDPDPRGVSSFPEQRGVSCWKIPTKRRSLHEFTESNVGRHAIPVPKVNRQYLSSCIERSFIRWQIFVSSSTDWWVRDLPTV